MFTPSESRLADPTNPAIVAQIATARSYALDPRTIVDFELLATGACLPAFDFSDRATVDSIASHGCLRDGEPFPRPILFPVDDSVTAGETLSLRDPEGVILALLEVRETYEPPPEFWIPRAAAGVMTVLRRPPHPDFAALRRWPEEIRRELVGAIRVTAWFADQVIDASMEPALLPLIESEGSRLIVFAFAENRVDGDFRRFSLVKAIEIAVRGMDAGRNRTRFVVLPKHQGCFTDGGPAARAAIALNYGANAIALSDGIGSAETARIAKLGCSVAEIQFPHSQSRRSSVDVAERPERPAFLALLERAFPPKHRKGVTLWFTGLSQSGKSTIARLVCARLLEFGRSSTVLDGDVVRTHLSKGLGFSREDRDVNVRRIGFVAAEITRHGGIAIVAAIAPYRTIRMENRRRIENYVEVFVNAPVDVCESRDQKGQYAKARRGEIRGFTGVDDPYEAPSEPEVECRTDRETAEESADRVIRHLIDDGWLRAADRID